VETYEQRRRRDEAAGILESTEMLIWFSAARNEVGFVRVSVRSTGTSFLLLFIRCRFPSRFTFLSILHATNYSRSEFKTDVTAKWQSIPQTRQYYENIVLGIEDQGKVEWCEEWEEESAWVGVASPRSAKGKEKERERGKKRVSSGQSGA
jgi:hypothetical protein